MNDHSFTNHAAARLEYRSKMSIGEAQRIIDSEKSIPIGREGKKIHKLFWSKIDSYWYVAVQDEFNGEVITILPFEYNRWQIAKDTLQKARRLIEGEPLIEKERPEVIPLQPNPASVWKFTAYVRICDGRIVTRHIDSLKFCDFGDDLESLRRNPEAIKIIQELLDEIISSGEICEGVIVRRGNSKKVFDFI